MDQWDQYTTQESEDKWTQFESNPLVEIDSHTGQRIQYIRKDRPLSFLETIKDYLGLRQQPKTTSLDIEAIETGKIPFDIREEVFGTGIQEELHRVVGRGLSGFTGGISDLFKGGEAKRPETIGGTLAGTVAELGGFILGPFKGTKGLMGTRLAPTATGLKGIAQIMAEGGATLGISSGLSRIIPAFMEDENFTRMGIDIFNSTAMGTLVGTIYPGMGLVPTKPLRIATGLAIMDKIRAGFKEWFTIDDIIKGIQDGTIDKKELAQKSFDYLMDIYFLSNVPSMKKQLQQLKENPISEELTKISSKETEDVILELNKKGLLYDEPIDGIKPEDVETSFGSEEMFNNTYRLSTEAKDKATKVEAMYNKADAELEALRKPSLKKLKQDLVRMTVDVSGNIKKELLDNGGEMGKQAVILHDLILGANAKSANIIEEGSKNIYGDLSKSEEILLNRIIQSRRTVAIDKYKEDIKHPEGLGGEEHQSYLDKIPKEILNKLNEKADLYFGEMKKQLDDLRYYGLISEESYNSLVEKGEYSPRKFIQYIDPENTYQFGGKKIMISDSGIKGLDEGSERTLENNSRLLLGQVISRTQARIFRNEANKALYVLASNVPDNGVVRLPKVMAQEVKREVVPEQVVIKGALKEESGIKYLVTAEEGPFEKFKVISGKAIHEEIPAEMEVVNVVIHGKKETMFMPREFAKEWVLNDPAVNTQVANIVGWLSGSKILKPMATGINPEFALTNMPRDILHVWLTTHEYSSHGPIALPQMGKDFAKVAHDAIFRDGSWADYINEGGGMSFLTHQGRVGKKIPVWSKFQEVMGWLGETSEVWTRLALRNRAIENGKEPYEATWIARNYLDFSQGGQFSKAVDTAVPYLNAGIQGTRGIIHSAREKPQEFIWKVAQLGTLSMGLYLANKYGNPECWEAVSDRDKVNNFIITTPFTYYDETGDKRHLYFKIAKDQGHRIISTIFDSIVGKSVGDKINVDQLTQAAQDFIPIIPTQKTPPSFTAMMGYFANKNFWMNQDIWKGPEVIPREEYTNYTHPGLVKMGKLTGLSPERMGYALQQYFTYGNIYSSIVGGGSSLIMNNLPEGVREKTNTEILKAIPFLRKFLSATDPYAPYRKEMEQLKLEDVTRRYLQTRKLDEMSEVYYSKKEPEKFQGIKDYILSAPVMERQELVERFVDYGRIHNIPDRRWWLDLKSMSPEARAVAFWNRWQTSDESERHNLETYLKQVPSIVSDRMIIKFNELKNKTKEQK